VLEQSVIRHVGEEFERLEAEFTSSRAPVGALEADVVVRHIGQGIVPTAVSHTGQGHRRT